MRRTVWIVLGVIALAGVGWFAWRWTHGGAEEVSVDKAVERAKGGSAGSTEKAAELRPGDGVYTFSATGTETLSILGISQQWGPTIPVTVSALDAGCWRMRIDYSTNHHQSLDYCPSGRELHEVAGETAQTFDLVAAKVGDTTEFHCDPPVVTLRLDARPGDSWAASCSGSSAARGTHVTSAGTNTFVGRESMRIGEEKLDTLHYRLERTLTGDQKGGDRDEIWYDARTGLMVKAVYDVSVASPSPIGDITYTGAGTMTLASTRPAG